MAASKKVTAQKWLQYDPQKRWFDIVSSIQSMEMYNLFTESWKEKIIAILGQMDCV